MFARGTLYHPKKFMDMNKNCPCCGQTFEPEPGYYFGAMFISYGFSAAYFLGVWMLSYIFFDEVGALEMMVAIILVVVGLLPLTFRWSRVLWISIFVRFEKDSKNIFQE
ncbi:DUF983 domain-containing protein [Fulvivirga sp. M361]|nr:DUF983 domain-containing protein [Fulvivirga sp. M361]TRX60880.1 DUF983 domain-containing protein [Fulvivirga sp. M361]